MSRLGIFAAKMEAIREQHGLTQAGFRQDGTDMAGNEKRAMEQEMYRRAHLPSGLGGPTPPNGGDESDEGTDEG